MSFPAWQPDQIPPAEPSSAPDTVSPPAVPAPSPGSGRPKKQDRTTLALLLVASLIAVGGVGFALGHVTATSSTSSSARPSGLGGRSFASLAPGQTFGPDQFGGARAGAAAISGTVQSFDGTNLVLVEANGGSVTIEIAGTTTYHNETAASASQITAGTAVTVAIDTSSPTNALPSPGSSVARTLTAGDVLITTP